MQSGDIARIIAIMLAIGLVVFVVVQIARFARNDSVTTQDSATEQIATDIDLIDYAESGTKVIMTHSGRVIAKEDHREIRVTVSQKSRVLEVIRGYDDRVLLRRSFSNTAESYETFLKAINFYGFLDRQDGTYGDDEEGICPRSTQTIVELKDNGDSVERLWSTTCKKSYGTLAGNSTRIRELFKKQIPEYTDLTSGIRL